MLDPKLSNNSFDFAAQLNPDPALILATLAKARNVDGDDLGSVATGTVVNIRGFAQPGLAGLLTAPLSGQPCVWYRSAFFPGAQFRPLPSIAPSDGPPAINDYEVRRTLNPTEEISTAPFVVGGRQPGVAGVTVDPLVADVDTDVLAANQMWKGRRGWSKGLMVEWILPPGVPVLALGEVGPDRSLQVTGSAGLLVSTKDEGRIVARDQAGSRWGAHDMGTRTVKMQRFNVKVARVNRVLMLGMWGFTALAALAILITVLFQVL